MTASDRTASGRPRLSLLRLHLGASSLQATEDLQSRGGTSLWSGQGVTAWGHLGRWLQGRACAFSSLRDVVLNKSVPWSEHAGCGSVELRTSCPPFTPASLMPWCLSPGDPGIGLMGMRCLPSPQPLALPRPHHGPHQSRGCQLTGPHSLPLAPSVAFRALVLDPGQQLPVFNRAPSTPTLSSHHPESRDCEPSRPWHTPVSCSPWLM